MIEQWRDIMTRLKMLFGILVLFTLLVVITGPGRADTPPVSLLGGSPMGGFTYQGALTENGAPARGVYDFWVKIYDAPVGGTQLAECSNSTTLGLQVDRGLFTLLCLPAGFAPLVTADNLFNGQPRYLEVQVKASAAAVYTTLLPRQPINPAPYAMSLRPGATITDLKTTANLSTVNNNKYIGLLGMTGSSATSAAEYASAGFHGGYSFADIPPGYYDSGGIFAGPNGLIAVTKTNVGDGVIGLNISSGSDGWGGRFETNTTDGAGVVGYMTATGATGSGVEGIVYSSTGTGLGVLGQVNSPDAYGVAGLMNGYSVGDNGTFWKAGGLFGGRNGVIGITKEDYGHAITGYDKSPGPSSYAGFFRSDNGNGVYIETTAGHTGLTVVGGTKNADVPTSEGDRLLYTEESSEVWFTDYGFGKLQNGVMSVPIDPLFAETVDLSEPYHVFVQVYGDADVYVTNRTAASFEVRLRGGANGGDPNVEFSYRLVAKRLGYADDRLELAPAPQDGLSSQPPEIQPPAPAVVPETSAKLPNNSH
jgi:hypothetical protein